MKKYTPTRLTEGFIKKLQWQGKVTVVRDTKVTGLMVTVHKGCKSYKVQKDLWSGKRGMRRLVKTVRYTIGTTDDKTLEEARREANDIIKQINQGEDPNESYRAIHADTWTVEEMYKEYIADMKVKDRAECSMTSMQHRLDKYLHKWKKIPITEIKRSMAREMHRYISEKHGKVVANQSMGDFRACYNFALKVVDNPDILPTNPIMAVTFNRVRRKSPVIMPDDMPRWWQVAQGLNNPLRRDMHTLGLLSGLRPGTLVSVKREWVNLEAQCISIPRMKSGRSFDLPLSEYMVNLVKRILAHGEVLYPKSEWLFPTRSKNAAGIIATQVWKEKALPSETGHILRHTYRTTAQRIGINQIDARLLLDHKVQGIDGVYIHEKALFDRLLAAQETMTKAILELCEAK